MSRIKTIFMFCGQGAQYLQMGQTVYRESGHFRDWMHRMDTIVHKQSGYSVVDILYNNGNNKSDIFDRMLFSHPAIFMVQFAMTQTLIEMDITPDIMLGASLGSFTAATVAGHVNVEDALTAVITQAKIVESNCQKGGMIAIFSDHKLYQEDALRKNSQIASYNFPTHFVISAKQERLKDIEDFLRVKNVTFQRLQVSFAFHSPWIEEAKESYINCIQSIPYRSEGKPIVCCAKSDIINTITPDYFWTVAREPIRFQQTIEKLENNGVYKYIDVGPAGTLSTFLKYLLPSSSQSKAITTMTPFGCNLEKLKLILS